MVTLDPPKEGKEMRGELVNSGRLVDDTCVRKGVMVESCEVDGG